MNVFTQRPRELAPGVTLTPLGRAAGAQAVRLDFAPGGVLPGHEAGCRQLFAVVRGRGWVRGGEDGERVRLDAGQAVVFEAGEWHESGSPEWMTAIVLESDALELPDPPA